MTSVADRATALKHSVGGSTINKIVCKASSHDLAGPKKKHIDYLITLTNSPQVSMPSLADMLGERFTNASWVVSMKALITSHNLITLGNEKFLQCLATRTNPFEMESFSDRSSVLASEMTRYIHKYSRYLGAYCTGYRTTVLDIYRIPRGERSPFRTMDHSKLLKVSSVFQKQLDLLVDLDITQGELTNGVINTAFLMLYKDLIKLYAVYNDALLNVLEHFFEMKKAQCKEAVDIYRKFLTRQESVHNFLKLAEEIGVDQKTHLNLRQVPADLLQALEQHITEMDAIRKSANNQKPSPEIKAASEKLSELKDKKSGSGRSTPTFRSATPLKMPDGNEESLGAQKKRFEELQKRASEKKLGIHVEATATPVTTATATSGAGRKSPEGDEFDKIAASRSTPQLPHNNTSGGGGAIDELFSINWSASTTSVQQGGVSQGGGASFNPFAPQQQTTTQSNNPWGGASGYQEVSLFPHTSPDPLLGGPPPPSASSGIDVLQPIAMGPLAATSSPSQQPKRLTSDVDTSLVQAAANLSLELTGPTGIGSNKTNLQWRGPTPQQSTLTGGPMYHRTPAIQPTTLPPTGYTGQPVGAPGMFGGGQPGFFPPQGGQPMMYGAGMGMQPGGYPQGQWGQVRPMGGGMGGGMGGAMYGQGGQGFYNTPQQQQPFF